MALSSSKPFKPKKCSSCKSAFSPARPMQKACSPLCALSIARDKRIQAERKEHAAKKKALRPRGEWMKLAQAAFNRYARLRDLRAGYGCITCGARPEQKFGGTMDCGHYLSTGSAPHLRFRLDNVALQCVKDNRYLGGVAAQFRMALIERNGLEKVEALEANHKPAKFDIEYLQRIRAVFSKKARRLEKRMESA